MTKTKALKKLFKKMFNYDAEGNSATSVIVDAAENAEMSGGGSSLKYIKDDPSDKGGVIEGLVEGEAGQVNVASGLNAHAEGGFFVKYEDEGVTYYTINTASGDASHAEGIGTTASNDSSHAEGSGTTASGECSHAEGVYTTASGKPSHAEGDNTTASGNGSHAEGFYTIANHKSQHVIGEYNIADPSTTNGTQRGNYVFIIGNGTSTSARSNALAIKWDGTFVFANGTEITPAQFQSLLALLS